MRAVLLAVLLLLAGCNGTAPPLASPGKALNAEGSLVHCDANTPPAGYRGPVSPFAGSCLSEGGGKAVAPAGQYDYSQGQPARAVR